MNEIIPVDLPGGGLKHCNSLKKVVSNMVSQVDPPTHLSSCSFVSSCTVTNTLVIKKKTLLVKGSCPK